MKVFDIKKKVATKVAKGKAKVAKKMEKVKGGKTACMLAGACAGALALGMTGCQNPAQRAQTAETNIEIFGGNITFGSEFVSLAQANETGGNDAGQTASPSNPVSVPIDVRYNDAIAGATSASKGLLETLTSAGANKVLEMMSSKSSGTVTVEKKDGGTMDVKCENGQCFPM